VAKVPFIIAVGEREMAERTIALRRLGDNGQEILPMDEALATLAKEITPPDMKIS
jgi:threonyl-tRNA synthetase